MTGEPYVPAVDPTVVVLEVRNRANGKIAVASFDSVEDAQLAVHAIALVAEALYDREGAATLHVVHNAPEFGMQSHVGAKVQADCSRDGTGATLWMWLAARL